MLTKADDYPIHQLPVPIAYAGTDRNFYDRYFFNGYSKDGEVFFAAAMGIYPHLNIIDGSFCVVADGKQYNVHASRILGMERMDTVVGPIAVDVLEPLVKLRVRCADNQYGVKGEFTFTKRADGRVLRLPSGNFFELRNGLITEIRCFFDTIDWVSQLTGRDMVGPLLREAGPELRPPNPAPAVTG